VKFFKIRVVGLFIASACSLLIIFSISYYALSKLTFAGDRIIYGKKQSELAREIREELLKRKEISQIAITSEDNYKLSGFLVKREGATANLIVCHGYRGGKEFMYGLFDMFPNWNILAFDFRAHGESQGDITSIGCHEYKDVLAVTRFMKKTFNNQTKLPLFILGISMGGAATLKATEIEPDLCDAMIIDSSYSRLNVMIMDGFGNKSGLPHYPFFPIIKQMFHYVANCDVSNMNPVESVKKIKKPILFIHSCNDTFTTPKRTLELYANVPDQSKCKVWIGPNCRHGCLHTYYSALYKEKVEKFLRQSVPTRNA
jgi:pimeloyl-ACP methyl ester carboxylesterase